MTNFMLISHKRKVGLFVRFLALVVLMVLIQLGVLGTYLPMEFWEVVRLYLITSIVLGVVRSFTITSYRKRQGVEIGERDNFILGFDSLISLITGVAMFVGALVILNIPFQTFLASISLVAVALVLIFRDYISNYLDSFRLMFSTDFRLGDYIKVGENSRGAISDISFRATKLKTDEGDVLFIPNTRLITSEVVNYSKVKFKRITVPFSLPTEAVHPLTELEERLKSHLLHTFPELIQEKKIFLRILNIKEWHTDFALEVSVDSYNFSIEDKIVKEIYSSVLQYEAENADRRYPPPIHRTKE